MTETLANGYSSESTPTGAIQRIPTRQGFDVFKNLCVLVHLITVYSLITGRVKFICLKRLIKLSFGLIEV